MLLAGLDVGTTNVKAIVFTPEGTPVASASVPTITHYPRPGEAYYEPEELWRQTIRALRDAISQLPAGDARRIRGIAVASMGEAGVPLSANGTPTAEAIAWFDARPTAEAKALGDTIGRDRLFGLTGLSLQPIWSLCKLLWLREHRPDAFAGTVRWLNVADWIAYRLCGVSATDYSLASRTHALDIQRLAWADDLLSEIGCPKNLFAPLVPSGSRLDTISRATARLAGLPLDTMVAAGGHDHVCGALAVGVTEPGEMLNSVGTAEAQFLPLSTPMTDATVGEQGYTQGVHVVPGRYYAFGGQYTSGASIEWLRSVIAPNAPYRDLIAEAEATPPGSLGVMFLPYLRIAAPPYDDPKARGTFIGLTTDTTRGAVVRSVFEGLAFEARSTLEPLLRHAGITDLRRIVSTGGVTRNRLLMRIKSAVLGLPTEIAAVEEATALGAAMLGGIAAGVYRDVPDALATVRIETTRVEPAPEDQAIYDLLVDRVYHRLYPTIRDLHHEVNAVQHELTTRNISSSPVIQESR